MRRIAITSFLFICLAVFCAGEVSELPLGTSGNRAFVELSDDRSLQNPVIIGDDIRKMDCTGKLYFYFDHSRSETSETITRQTGFKPTGGNSSWGHVDAACWFRFDFISKVSTPTDLNLEVLVTGFPLTIGPGQQGTVYFMLDYPAGILSNVILYRADVYRQHGDRRIGLNAIILGINLAMILYNLFLSIWTRRKEFMWFVAYMLCFTFHIYLREDYINSLFPFLHDYYFGLPSISFAILFAMEFLKTKKHSPVIHKILIGTFGVSLFYSFTVLVFRSRFVLVQRTQAWFQLFVVFLAIAVSIVMIAGKHRVGIYYLGSWLPVIAANFALQFEQLGILQTNTPFSMFVVREGFYIAAAIQALLLSVSLANQINIFRRKAESEESEKIRYMGMDRIKTEFIMNVSHELRTPLTIINGTAENIIAGKYGSKISSDDSIFRTIRRNGSKLLVQINNLLDIGKMERKRRDIRIRALAIVPFARQLVAGFESLASAERIELGLYSAISEQTAVSADSDLLELVLLNLLSNALKFTSENGSIRLSLADRDGRVEVSVTDTGPGIPEEDLDRIFERFYQSEDSGHNKHEGTGIGLSLVRESVELLGSTISAENMANGGMTFTFALEYSSENTGTVPKAGTPAARLLHNSLEPTQPTAVQSTAGPVDILLAEDNIDMQNYILAELHSSYSVRVCANGREALEYLSAGNTPRLILSDIMMPEMNGSTFFKAVRAMDRTGHIPFLFISARAMEEEKAALLEYGAMDYICKPFSASELKAKIGSILKQDSELKIHYRNKLRHHVLKAFEEAENDNGGKNAVLLAEEFCTRYGFTKRESEVLSHMVTGLRDKEIADRLGLAVSTISNTVSAIYRKSGVAGRADIIRAVLSGKC
ncbi:MAG: response regulator [Spirochaetales bacterium]|nr:response regulator [Spirochaetales bacterium]